MKNDMEYLELTNRIWGFNENKSLGLSAISVYFYLLKIGSEAGYTKFTVSDSKISRELKMTRKTVKVCKEKLCKFGIISYHSRNGIPSDFELNSDYPLIFNDVLEKPEVQSEILEFKKAQKKVEPKVVEVNSIKKRTQQISSSVEINNSIPSIEEFLEYAQSLEMYDPQLHSEIQLKYKNWRSNSWKNSANRPITDWKSTLKSVLPYLKNSTQNNSLSVKTIPRITPPKLSNV
ncbi:hypothetical protein [Frigoriflavimonas asaccharolytica]|uniref:Helix-turn-helix protein n=1 Tax=Frigoriflavimonas asaccharolytica TaxID=2735899 RepID=A0A8J8GDI3_9FLAO|nr:hypothetical protein [Frigoriflavimonas asaccharolytica]NRS93802.1 hypothetical protein [Frigoriflavimonas asaccharolytica]